MGDERQMRAALFAMIREKMDLLTVESLAKDLNAHDKLTFDLVGPKGRRQARFRDADMGVFEIEGKVFHVNDFKYVADVHCENIGNFA